MTALRKITLRQVHFAGVRLWEVEGGRYGQFADPRALLTCELTLHTSTFVVVAATAPQIEQREQLLAEIQRRLADLVAAGNVAIVDPLEAKR